MARHAQLRTGQKPVVPQTLPHLMRWGGDQAASPAIERIRHPHLKSNGGDAAFVMSGPDYIKLWLKWLVVNPKSKTGSFNERGDYTTYCPQERGGAPPTRGRF